MKKTIAFFFGLLLVSTSLYAGESSLIFKDSSSFQIARSLKLGHAMGEMDKPNKSGVEKGGLCESDADCLSSEKCIGNTCVNVCDPNPCSSGYCLDEGNHSYSCVECLNDDHCSADKKCSGNACVDVCTGNNCTQQSKLCSSNGNHGYLCYGCTSDAACANDEFCDTTTKTCRTLCPDFCEGNLICEIIGAHEAKCSCQTDEDCPEGYTCDQETKQCVAADCAGMLLASRDDVAVAIDAASFSTAMSSGKNIIAVTENLTVSSAIDLGSKKLVGPKYFSDIPVCKEANTPLVTASDTIKFNNGEISDIKIKSNASESGIYGTGNIKNAEIDVVRIYKGIEVVGGTLNMNGINSVYTSNNATILIQLTSATLNISGSLSLSGPYYNHGINIGSTGSYSGSSNVTISSSGSVTFSGSDGSDGFWVQPGSTLTANGPIKFSDVKGEAISGSVGAKIILNAKGNILKGKIRGISMGNGDLTIAGDTSIYLTPSASTGISSAIDNAFATKGNLTISAPVSAYGLRENDQLLGLDGAEKAVITSTVKSISGKGKVVLQAKSGYLSGSILGASSFTRWMGSSTPYPFYAKAGSKLQLGGTCKKSPADKTISDKTANTTTPPSPFTSGC